MARIPSVLDDHFADLVKWLTPKLEGGEGRRQCEVVQMLAERGVQTSDSSLSRWWAATAAQRKMLARIDAGRQAVARLETQLPGEAPQTSTLIRWVKDLIAQVVATGETPDPEALAVLIRPVLEWEKIQDKRSDLALDREKFAAAMRTKIEAGIQAIHDEIKGDAEAEALVARLKERVLRATASEA